MSSSACHSSSKSCIWPNHKHPGHSSQFHCYIMWKASARQLNQCELSTIPYHRSPCQPFLSIINSFKNLQNVSQLACLLLFEWSFLWVFYSAFHGVFPFPDYISSKLNKFWETGTFACLCFKTSTLNPNFQFTWCTASLCPVSKADLSLVSISTEVGMKPPPWTLRSGQGRHPLRLGRR